jgi:hypothetical protein
MEAVLVSIVVLIGLGMFALDNWAKRP